MDTIPQEFAIAIQHHRGGRLQAAEQVYRRILRVDPKHADAHHLLGVIAHQMGKNEVAVEYIERAIGFQGNAAFFHCNLGTVYHALHRFPEAVACFRRALELKPDYADAAYNLGNALKDQGTLAGTLYSGSAVACFRRALELRPGHAEARNNLGVVLQEQRKPDEALACFRRALELRPDYAEAHNNLGSALKDQGKLDEAVESFRRALELRPDYAEARNNLGCALKETGDFRGAEESFRAALRCDSRFVLAHYELAGLLRGKLPQQDLAALGRLLEQGSASGGQNALTEAERLLLHFGLAQVLDARGEYAEAARHLERGNALQLSEGRMRGGEYDPKEYEVFVTRMIALSTPDFFQGLSSFGLESELPVFVVGLPRSGTTLIEQILAGHSQVFGAGETGLVSETMAALGGSGVDSLEGLRRLDRQTAQRLASGHLEKLRGLGPAALRIVDKMPENYLFLGLLAALFPRAKLIHCRRDLRDVAVSCWMTHFKDLRWTNDQEHIVSRFHQYQRLMEHWRKVLPVPLLEVDYEETVADLETVARRLVAWCGLEWEPGCLEFHRGKRAVRTASAVQVRQPLYATSVGRWQHYEQALAALFRAISDRRQTEDFSRKVA